MEELKQKTIVKENNHKNKKHIRRNNAKLYPIYKMFSWDLICFYSIEFLFYTITKGLTASQVLIISACYVLFKILMQIPAVAITDILGHRKSLIIGNSLLLVYMAILINSVNIYWIIFGCLIKSLGFDIKTISETNLLYDSVSTKGGEGLYSKLDSKGASWYYWLDGIICIATGYLFVINNYLPMIICMGFVIVSIILSAKFKDVYKKEVQKVKVSKILKEYSQDLKTSVKFIVKSSRMKSYIIFGSIFYGTITIIDLYRSDLIISKGMPEEQYSMMFAVLTILAGISVMLSKKVHKKFKNRTLTFISLSYILCCIVVGIIANTLSNSIAIPMIIILYVLMKMFTSIWYVLEYKYLKNFTTEEIRNKIMFTYELIGGVITSILAFIGSMVLEKFEVSQAFLLVSLAALIAIVLSLDYMRSRFGLKPKDYKKEDINFKIE